VFKHALPPSLRGRVGVGGLKYELCGDYFCYKDASRIKVDSGLRQKGGGDGSFRNLNSGRFFPSRRSGSVRGLWGRQFLSAQCLAF